MTRARIEVRPGRLSGPFSSVKLLVTLSGAAIVLAGCAAQPTRQASLGGSSFDPRLGVSASPRVVADGDPVPRGGGSYLVGHPYVIAGRTYVPSERPGGYSAVGTASWYGDAFHGRRTANGEVFDKGSISAAHPTLPLPSYVRVTNMSNGRSMIVRVNDRGPYHGNRVMDVSQRVAESLDFRRAGTARIKVDYVGRASIAGSDDEKLLATLRTDGSVARLDGTTEPDQVATAEPTIPSASVSPTRVARLTERDDAPLLPDTAPSVRPGKAPPVPPSRPYDADRTANSDSRRRKTVALVEARSGEGSARPRPARN